MLVVSVQSASKRSPKHTLNPVCVLQSSLPNAEPGKRIDNLLFKAVSMLHAPSALLAVNILYDEITHASLFLASKHLTIGLNTIIILLCVDPCSQSSL